MKSGKTAARILGVIFYVIGIVIGLTLFGGSTWADFEASLFDSSMGADSIYRSLKCPILIAQTETGTVTGTFKNPLDRPLVRYMRTHISEGYITLFREVINDFTLEPGEQRQVEWQVSGDDAVFGSVALVRLHLNGRYPLPSATGSCGILVVSLFNFTGTQTLALMVGVSVLSTALGLGLWITANKPLKGHIRTLTSAMIALAVMIIAGVIISIIGMWEVGAILLVIVVLLIIVIIAQTILGS